uniref:G_PROTEIN_RECEP_F1_2 domain-containing protein n=1 Tax=Bursaphelenchus xylophilus TaxID=6326 RepID=A0A1I7SUM3_BURXY
MCYELLYGCVLFITVFSVFFNVPLYILVLRAIVVHRTRRPFNSPFFTIFVALGVVDLICYALYLFVKKPTFFNLVPSIFRPYNTPNVYVRAVYVWFYVFAYFQYQLVFLLNLNRFTCLVTPKFYRKFCQHKTTKTCIALCAILSFFLAFPGFSVTAMMSEYTVELGGVTRTMHYGPVMTGPIAQYLSMIWKVHVYSLMVIGTVLYGWMFLVTRQASMSSMKSYKQKRRPEMRLFYMALGLFTVNSGFAVYFWLSSYSSPDNHWHEWILLVMSDIYDLPNGIILWFTCRDIRRNRIPLFLKTELGRGFTSVCKLKFHLYSTSAMIFELFVAATVAITVFSVFFSAPLYIAVMVIIIKYRRKPPFNSSFYSIFIASGVVDLVCYSLYALIKKPIFWGIIYPPYDGFDKPNFAAKLSALAVWIFALLQYEYTCLLTLNRFAGICLPEFYFKIKPPVTVQILSCASDNDDPLAGAPAATRSAQCTWVNYAHG